MSDNVITLNTGKGTRPSIEKSHIVAERKVSNNYKDAVANHKSLGAQLKEKLIESMNSNALVDYSKIIDDLFEDAYNTIYDAIYKGLDPIYIFNPIESKSGILISNGSMPDYFNDPAFIMLLNDRANQEDLSVSFKMLPTLSGKDGKSIRPVPALVITIK